MEFVAYLSSRILPFVSVCVGPTCLSADFPGTHRKSGRVFLSGSGRCGYNQAPAQLFVEPAILIVRAEVLFEEVFLAF